MSSLNTDIKLGALVEEVPEGSPPSPSPPTRSPSDRLRDKVARDICISVSKGQCNDATVEGSPATSCDESSEKAAINTGDVASDMAEAEPIQFIPTRNSIDTEKSKLDLSNQVPVSANVDKKTAETPCANQTHDRYLKFAQRGFHLDTSNSPEAEPSYPGAFLMAGIEQNDQDVVPAVPSVIMDVEDLPIAAELAEEGKPVEASKLEGVVVNYQSCTVRIGIFVLFIVLTGAIIGGVLGAEKRKNKALGECIVDDPSMLGNGECDGGEYNTEKCKWDYGDCSVINRFPGCALTPKESSKLGDGICDGWPWLTRECGSDAGDCSKCRPLVDDNGLEFSTAEESLAIIFANLGDGLCNPFLNTEVCGFDGGDCSDFNKKYPDCRSGDFSCSSFNATFPSCIFDFPEWLGDGICDHGLNSVDCAYDGGDCFDFNNRFPDCRMGDLSCSSFNNTYPGCLSETPEYIKDGICDHTHNNPECNWDGGDCVEFNSRFPYCDASTTHVGWIGDETCDKELNTLECGWDGGACNWFNKRYPLCDAEKPYLLGNDICDAGVYNTSECGWDGGDCSASVQIDFTICKVESKEYLADGKCDGGEYNVEECEWDGGDCAEFNNLYPGCHVSEAYWIGDGQCDGREYNTAECGWDGGDCI